MSKVTIQGDASGTGIFTIASPNSNTDRTLTLPDEAGTVLTNSSDIPAANLTGSLPAGMGGKVLQVVHTYTITKTDIAQGTNTNILTASITPSSASNKILAVMQVNACNRSDVYLPYCDIGIILKRGSSNADNLNSTGNQPAHATFAPSGETPNTCTSLVLDSPATTSSITYHVNVASWERTAGVNQNYYGTNTAQPYMSQGISTLTLLEIAA